MVKSNVPLVVNSRDATNNNVFSRAYQFTTYNSNGQNLIQGAIEHISVSEVNFPYDIPNVQAGPPVGPIISGVPAYPSTYNAFRIIAIDAVPLDDLSIVIPVGFYDGTELADAITKAMKDALTTAGIDTSNAPTCIYSDSTNLFSFLGPETPASPADYTRWKILSPATFSSTANTLSKDLLSIMGYWSGSSTLAYGVGIFSFTSPLISNSAPLSFTQYIDITSPQLCQFQFLRDGSTTNLARRINVICRLYIANNVAIAGPEGSRPFIINRQYQNARVMKWTSGNSIGSMDIELFDDVGQPLLTTWQPRPFQITFNVHEHHDDKEKPMY